MDTLRGGFGAAYEADDRDFDLGDDEPLRDPPPPEIGTDERRMQVRAYNHWASLLDDRSFPSVEDLEPDALPDFGPYSVLLDFTNGIDDPGIQYLGAELAGECDARSGIESLSDVPARSLLTRITDHYMQILANQAPIGFEAEFVNQRGKTILYRGILLPFSSDDDTIDFIYGVINWKEMADQLTADELLLEIGQALDAGAPVEEQDDAPDEETEAALREPDPVTDWADGPDVEVADSEEDENEMSEDSQGSFGDSLPRPSFGLLSDAGDPDFTDEGEEDYDDDDDLPGIPENFLERVRKREPALPPPTAEEYAASPMDGGEWDDAGISMPEPAPIEAKTAAIPQAYEPDEDQPAIDEIVMPAPAAQAPVELEPEDEVLELSAEAVGEETAAADDLGLYDHLAAARELAAAARHSEDRSRSALYAAVGRAYDFSLSAEQSPEEFEELIEENGLTVQDRAPMTPVVKLVFGADYDKTRLTEYAAVLGHAHRVGIERGTLARYLGQAEGGLKGVVQAERRLRREEAGKPVNPADSPREALAKKLRELEVQDFEAISAEGPEFALVMIRRLPSGEVAMIGEVPEDVPLVEKAARKLLG